MIEIRYLNGLQTEGILTFKGRVVIPREQRGKVLKDLHAAHQGVTNIMARATCSVWWPGLTNDIGAIWDACSKCVRDAPSQPTDTPEAPVEPVYPFQMICSNFFAVRGIEFPVVVDRYSNYPIVYRAPNLTAAGVVLVLRNIFMNFGVPERMTTDGGTAYTSHEMGEFLKNWGVEHHQTAAYHPHSNLQAKGAVKSVKRFVEESMGPGGSLNNNQFVKAIFTYCNKPSRGC